MAGQGYGLEAAGGAAGVWVHPVEPLPVALFFDHHRLDRAPPGERVLAIESLSETDLTRAGESIPRACIYGGLASPSRYTVACRDSAYGTLGASFGQRTRS